MSTADTRFMSLKSGVRFGPYEIQSAIGAGGMGEVYRARDTRLKRDVAVKVLSGSVSQDAGRLARFQREAELLAALNHPNIAAVYGVESVDGVTGIILELVDGPTLEERITNGPIPIDEAIGIARQIAEALESAHDQGIVHRDLKPSNIKLRADGKVKVLDFGLAKALDASPLASDAAQSPTLTSPALLTQAGVILGTAAYMSPEQAKGRTTDKRSDVWAFGCVVYEMATGARAFDGGDIAETLAAVLRDQPKWGALPTAAAPIAALLKRCLEKDPRQRLRDIGDAKFFLEDAANPSPLTATRGTVRLFPWVVSAAVVGVITGAAATALYTSRTPRVRSETPRLERLEITTTLADPLTTDPPGTNVAISPDGSRVVYSAGRGAVVGLLARTVENLEPKPVGEEPNTRTRDPFFSPDGSQVAYVTLEELKRAPTDGGPAVKICSLSAVLFRGGSWGPDGSIVFAQSGGLGLFQVPAAGGQPQQLAAPDTAAGELNYLRPTILPDGRTVLYTVQLPGGSSRIAARPLAGGPAVTVLERGFGAQYLPSGHLLFGQNQTLMAVPFDVSSLRAIGTPVPIAEDVATKVLAAVTNAAVASDDTIVYIPGRNLSGPRRVVWVDRNGKPTPAIEQPLSFPRYPRLSPDGRRLALTIGPSVEGDVWVYDLRGDSQPIKLTVEDHNLFPIWSPDGKRIAFLTRAATNHVSIVSADGSSAAPEILTSSAEPPVPHTWLSKGGDAILFSRAAQQTRSDLWLLHLSDRKIVKWLETQFDEIEARLSPNGEWVLYSSDQTGASEVWIRSVSSGGAPIRVSPDGGHDAVWSHDGNEIFYRNGFQMFSVRVVLAPALRVEKPRPLFEGGFEPSSRTSFDVAPDGRFIMIERIDTSVPGSIVVVGNLGERLKAQTQ